MIPYGRQNIDDSDIRAVLRVLSSDFLTQGPEVEKFENAVARQCGTKYAVAVNSATSALHIACLAAGLGPGDSHWTSPISFVASANCGIYCGSNVGFVDIDANSFNMSPSALERKLLEGRNKPRVLIPVHMGGLSCPMRELHRLASTNGITIIEDASHAIGASYMGKPVGCCEFSDMAVFSFHPVKIVTTGEGGIVVTNREDIYNKLKLLRNHGITRDAKSMIGESHGAWYYQQSELGFNYRMTDLQAALGSSQMERLENFVRRRNQLAVRYQELLKGLPVVAQSIPADSISAYHLYLIRLKELEVSNIRKRVFDRMRSAGIGVNVHYIPIHTQLYFARLGFKEGDFPEAEAYYREVISLPLFPDLKESQQDQVVLALQEALS